MQKKLLTTGNIFKRTDDRWCGVVWYMDEQGERKRKSFSGISKQECKDKITAYIAAFNQELEESDESKRLLWDSMAEWLRVFKFPSVERGTYDRLECTAKHQIYPLIGDKVVGDVTPADIKALLKHRMNEECAYTTKEERRGCLGLLRDLSSDSQQKNAPHNQRKRGHPVDFFDATCYTRHSS